MKKFVFNKLSIFVILTLFSACTYASSQNLPNEDDVMDPAVLSELFNWIGTNTDGFTSVIVTVAVCVIAIVIIAVRLIKLKKKNEQTRDI